MQDICPVVDERPQLELDWYCALAFVLGELIVPMKSDLTVDTVYRWANLFFFSYTLESYVYCITYLTIITRRPQDIKIPFDLV